MGQRIPLSFSVTAPGKQITTSGTSANTTLPFTSAGGGTVLPKIIRIGATASACVRLFPAGGGTATVNDTQVQPGDSIFLEVPAGYTTISVIQVTAAGVVQVSPLENM